MEKVKAEVKFYPVIDTERNFPGKASEFVLTITDLVTGKVVTNDGSGSATELIHEANGHTSTTNGVQSAGSKTVVVADGGTLEKGDVLDDGNGNLYTVKSVNGNNLGIYPKLSADIDDATDLNAVGNTGSYTFECQVANAGKIAVDVFHPELGNVPFKYEVVDETIEETLAGQDADLELIKTQLESLGGSVIMKAVI